MLSLTGWPLIPSKAPLSSRAALNGTRPVTYSLKSSTVKEGVLVEVLAPARWLL